MTGPELNRITHVMHFEFSTSSTLLICHDNGLPTWSSLMRYSAESTKNPATRILCASLNMPENRSRP